MLIFLKLGGSLITQKNRPFTARRKEIKRIAKEIQSAFEQNKDLKLLIGHGSGSFGHYAARDSGTRDGVSSPAQWRDFQKVWIAAKTLNQIVVDEMNACGLPVIALQPSAAISAANRQISQWNTLPIAQSLKHGLTPVIYGDVIFDQKFGGVILSTEDLFVRLIEIITPDQILIAGREKGVYEDFPKNQKTISTITPDNQEEFARGILSSGSIDVTGGMREKVKLMLSVVQAFPSIQVQVFSGETPGLIYRSLCGQTFGTRISNS